MTGRPALTVLFLLVGAAASTAIGFLLGLPWLLPILGAAVPYAVFFPCVRAGRYRAALGWVLLWAVFQSLAVGMGTGIAPEAAREAVFRGPPYAAEMLHWVRTGEGPEGSPRLFLPIHARHFAAFCVLSLVSLGGLGLVLGTILLNYMNFYVAELIRISTDPILALAMGWPIWAILRVAGFVAVGVGTAALGMRFLARLRHRPEALPSPTRVLLLGVVLVLTDIVLKATLAPFWQGILKHALTGL